METAAPSKVQVPPGATLHVTKKFRFDAGHTIPGHKGKCARPHGHTYTLEVTVWREGSPLDGNAILFDFHDLNDIVKPYIDGNLDHWNLNDVYEATSAEALCCLIFEDLKGLFAEKHPEIKLGMITIYETPDSSVTLTQS